MDLSARVVCEHYWSYPRFEPELERELRYCMRCGRDQQRDVALRSAGNPLRWANFPRRMRTDAVLIVHRPRDPRGPQPRGTTMVNPDTEASPGRPETEHKAPPPPTTKHKSESTETPVPVTKTTTTKTEEKPEKD